MNVHEMIPVLNAKFKSLFPNSYHNFSFEKGIGNDYYFAVHIMLAKNKSECVNEIAQNDPMHNIVLIHGFNEKGEQNDKLVMHNPLSYSRSPSSPYYYCDSIKVGSRRCGKDIEALSKSLCSLLEKLHEGVKKDAGSIQKLVGDKFNVASKIA